VLPLLERCLGLRRGRTLFLEAAIEEQRLLSHTLQQRQGGFLRLGRRGQSLYFLRSSGTAQGRLEGQTELLCGHMQPLGEQRSPNILRQSLHMLQQLLTASFHMGPLLRSNRLGQAGRV
jgi:hypothetical protein